MTGLSLIAKENSTQQSCNRLAKLDTMIAKTKERLSVSGWHGKCTLDLHFQQCEAETFAMRIESKRSSHAAAKRIAADKEEGSDIW